MLRGFFYVLLRNYNHPMNSHHDKGRRHGSRPATILACVFAVMIAGLEYVSWPRPCPAGKESIVLQQTDFVQANGIRIAYRMHGPAEETKKGLSPLVMITGYGGLMEMWPPAMLEPLARERRVIVFDNRGLGFSTSSDQEYSIELFAEDARTLLDALDIEQAHVLGWSMGAFIAQELALRHPDREDKLILLAGSCGGIEAIWPDDEIWQSLTDLSGTLEQRVNRMFSNLFPADWLREHPDPSLFFRPSRPRWTTTTCCARPEP
jgi:pimeloyl-ACP methyl ester carboxylesterase